MSKRLDELVIDVLLTWFR